VKPAPPPKSSRTSTIRRIRPMPRVSNLFLVHHYNGKATEKLPQSD